MNRRVLLDTGPLVALLNGRDKHHAWARLQWAQTAPPLLCCEAVLSEACFLLRARPGGSKAVLELLRRHVVEVAFHLENHVEAVARLMRKYASVPMSLADGCLVRMAELSPESAILTLDRDFRLYRKSGRHIVPVIMPEES
jgi:predicted nucleic acid-binding protein